MGDQRHDGIAWTDETLNPIRARHRATGKVGWYCQRVSEGCWPLPNLWAGVSVEDQATADWRIPLLLQTPAAVRWVSYEPALGPVDFGEWLGPDKISWVVVGGES